MDKKVLAKDIQVEGNNVIVTETTESILNTDTINAMLVNIKHDKEHLIRQNKNIIARYDALVEQEKELKEYLTNISTVEPEPLEVL